MLHTNIAMLVRLQLDCNALWLHFPLVFVLPAKLSKPLEEELLEEHFEQLQDGDDGGPPAKEQVLNELADDDRVQNVEKVGACICVPHT